MRCLPAFLLGVLLVLSALRAASVQMAGAIDSEGITRLDVFASFDPQPGRAAVFRFGDSDLTPVDVQAYDRSGLALPLEISHAGNDSDVSMSVPYDYVRLRVTTDDFTSKAGALWTFDLPLRFSDSLSSFNASVELPSTAALRATNGLAEDRSDRLAILWQARNVDVRHEVRLRALYETPEAAAGAGAAGPLAQPAVLLILLLAAAGYLFFSRRNPKAAPSPGAPAPPRAPPAAKPKLGIKTGRAAASRFPASISSALRPSSAAPSPSKRLESHPAYLTLEETDKEILAEIATQGGKTTQARLYLQTHLPKATLSRHLQSLENRQLVRRSQRGNRKLVSLGEIFLK